jgi:type IV pilus assembly protein PilA
MKRSYPSLAFPIERSARRGFTLIELMIVVVVIGVLSSLAMLGYRRYVNEAKTSEAREIIGSIKGGQEALLDETFRYLNVSSSIDTFYPSATPTGSIKTMWGASDPGFAVLGVKPATPVYFGYSTTASVAGDSLSTGANVAGFGTFGSANEPQYLVKAVCDIQPGGAVTAYISSNRQADIYGENVGE